MPVDLAGSLSDRIRGRIITPGDGSYDDARTTFNGMLDRRPGLIVRPVDVADVVSAVRWASEVDLPMGIWGGGHSVAGHSMPDEALLIDLSGWRGVRVDPVGRTAEALAAAS